MWSFVAGGKSRDYHLVTLLVNSTGGFADIDWGSALAIVSVYMSENLGILEVTTNPVELKESCRNNSADKIQFSLYMKKDQVDNHGL